VRAATVEEAVGFGEVVMEAIPFGRYEGLPAGNLSGKVFVTTSNYYSGRDREIEHGGLHPASWSPGTCPAPASSRLPTPSATRGSRTMDARRRRSASGRPSSSPATTTRRPKG
jgi:hypothetical protein